MAVQEALFFKEVFGEKKLIPLRIVIYGSKIEYKLKARRSDAPNSVGFYSPKSRTMYVLKTDQFISVCFHEMVHALYHNYSNKIPTWLNEGLAGHFEYAALDTSGNVQFPVRKKLVRETNDFLTKPQRIITSCLNKSYSSFHNFKEHRNYSVSRGIVNYLFFNNKEMLFTLMRQSLTEKSSLKIINNNYTGGIVAFAKDVKNWCTQVVAG
ncbi:MAG: DUF1570 domain-containing protein [Bacteroidia bacterium]